ncbi:MAG: hypothetical protein JWP31_612 [Aeromicrobium sp.]|nr:hypothetical protein [Aeromicrobium sp.]
MTSPTSSPTTNPASPESIIAAWLRDELGAEVVSIARQARWRPIWFVDAVRGGEELGLVVRADRGEETPLQFPLEHEMVFQRTLAEQGIRVPAVHGWIDDLAAYVMDQVPGRPDLADLDDGGRHAVMADYMGELARIHRLPIEPFLAAGVERADDPADAATYGMKKFEALWRSRKSAPDPLLEFMLAWLARNPVDPGGRESAIVWDSGQFHQSNGKLTALLDVEIGHIGDPMMDLAAFRMRDTVLHFGDFTELYAQYEAAGGWPVDLDAVELHHIAFTLTNELAFRNAMAAASPTQDYMTNLHWCSETNLHAIEALAERLGVPLVEPGIPEPEVGRADVAYEQLVQTLRAVETDDEGVSYQVRRAFRLARHVQRDHEIGRALDAADLDDLESLLGHRPATWADGDALLEAFVLADGGLHDRELVELLYRRQIRHKSTVGPAGSAMTTHHRCQPFRRTPPA